jgi:uncharacterized DUF497 family protein
LEIRHVVWLEDIVDKLRWKHQVVEGEVIEVLENHPRFVLKEAGFTPGEDVIGAFGRTARGRPLAVFFIYTRDQRAIIVSARDMSSKEKKRYDT